MVGLERTVVPLIGSEEFKIASTTVVVSFIVSFGVVKALANLVSGHFADAYGRKAMLVIGWLVGLPVPFMIGWGPSWGWIVAANALLGINQGFAWSMTVIMKIDLVGPKSRGVAVGLNEFAGYLSVGLTAFLTGYIAQRYGLRPAPFYLGIGYAVLGLVLSILLVTDTRHHVGLELAHHATAAEPARFWEIFRRTSFGDRNLFAASQAGLVNNLNDGMSWGIFPLFFASYGLSVERIGVLKAAYPAVWGVLQTADRPAQRSMGPQGPDRRGNVDPGGRIVPDCGDAELRMVAHRQRISRRRHGDGLSDADRLGFGRLSPLLARTFAQRLSGPAVRPRARPRLAPPPRARRDQAGLRRRCHSRAGPARRPRLRRPLLVPAPGCSAPPLDRRRRPRRHPHRLRQPAPVGRWPDG